MEIIERDQFKGDDDKVRHLIEARRFSDAAEPLIAGWNYQVTRKLLRDTQKQLSAVWAGIYRVRKEAGYTTEDISQEVLIEVEEWLRTLYKEGKIKKDKSDKN